jgi:ribokinase
MSGRIVVVGSLNMDLVGCAARIPVPGETIIGHTFFDTPGGKGANQAYAAARLGGRVMMLGCVGQDDFGRRMRANLETVGCDTTYVRALADTPSGIALIFVGDVGENSIMVVPGANHRLSPAELKRSDNAWADAAIVLLQLESPLATVTAAAQRARRAGAIAILDPAPAQQLEDKLLRTVDVLTPNETEAAILAGLQPSRLTAEDAISIARRLRARGPASVIVKLGAQGCLLLSDHEYHLLPAPSVKALDSTAAGDVFNGALAVALAEGCELKQACEFANRAAALSVTRRGAQSSAPIRSEVDQLLTNN